MSMSRENPKEYRVVGGSHDGEVFVPEKPLEQHVNEKAELTHVLMPHRSDDALREVYERTLDADGASILRHVATQDKNADTADTGPKPSADSKGGR